MRRLTIAMTAAPRARARSTVRLVSVVVPLWLIATTSVSDMSSRGGTRESSVAGQRFDGDVPSPEAWRSAAARLWPATAAVPWPMTRTRRHVPSRRRARTCRGSVSGPRRRRGDRRARTILPRRVLRNDAGASEISFSRKCGKSPRSMSRVVISACCSSLVGDRQRRAVVGEAADAAEVTGRGRVEHDDLAPGRVGALGIGGRLAVHPQVRAGLLDQAVGLARDDERVLGQADVERLAAAPQREEEPVGRGRGCGGDGHRALERGHRRPERVVERRPRRRAGVRTSAGMTLASVVISAGRSRSSSASRSA